MRVDNGVGGGGGGLTTKVIDDTDSPYTTQDEDLIVANTANGAVTVTLATADVTEGNTVRILMIYGTNDVTVNTEGSETIDPNGRSSVSITSSGWMHSFVGKDSTTWETGQALQPTASGVGLLDSDDTPADTVNVGAGSLGNAQNSVFIGVGAGDRFGQNAAVCIGGGQAGGDSVAIGDEATASANRSVAVGESASANNDDATAIGWDATANVSAGIAIGRGASVSTSNVARISRSQLVFGGSRDTLADADINNGELLVELDETNNAFRLRGKDSGGTVREATVSW